MGATITEIIGTAGHATGLAHTILANLGTVMDRKRLPGVMGKTVAKAGVEDLTSTTFADRP